MAAYAVVDWVSAADTPEKVAAAIETKLETLDSTTNVIRLLTVVECGPERYRAIMVYDG